MGNNSNKSVLMENELCDKPGIIITGDKVVKTTKVKKWVLKNKPSDYDVKYIDTPSSDFREVERQLQLLVDEANGIHREAKEKEVFNTPYDYKYTYRINSNTVLAAYTLEQFNLLKKWYNVEE